MIELASMSKQIFIFYLIISGNFIGNLLSCKTQKLFTENILVRHILGFATLYFFVVFVDPDSESANPTNKIIIAVMLYLLFIISTRCYYPCVFAIICILLLIYIIEQYKTYYNKDENKLKLDKNGLLALKIANNSTKPLVVLNLILLVFGFINYLGRKSVEYRPVWSWSTFWAGVVECKFEKAIEGNNNKFFHEGAKKLIS